jgi:MoaA/NifB/PqqE/SkfB family radical SAM enzyme
MKFKKIYVEITNSCNFSCSFCFPGKRPKRALSVDEFRLICQKIRPYTNYLYLHVLGEPLLHPHFAEIMEISSQYGFHTNITTNASLISKHQDLWLKTPPHQVNISLHDWEEQILPADLPFQLDLLIEWMLQLENKTYFNLRLWNRINGEYNEFTKECLLLIAGKLNLDFSSFSQENLKKGMHLRKHIYLQTAERFSWPGTKDKLSDVSKVAILSNGVVVPCCLDADGNLELGNIFSGELMDIIRTEKAQRIKDGFKKQIAVEDFCRGCGFK